MSQTQDLWESENDLTLDDSEMLLAVSVLSSDSPKAGVFIHTQSGGLLLFDLCQLGDRKRPITLCKDYRKLLTDDFILWMIGTNTQKLETAMMVHGMLKAKVHFSNTEISHSGYVGRTRTLQ